MEKIIFIGEYRKKIIKDLDDTLELYTKIRDKEELTQEEINKIIFNIPKNTFKINNLNYKEARHKRMQIIEWYETLKEVEFKTHLYLYDVSSNYEDISCDDELENNIEYNEEMINWKTEIDVFIYKDDKDRAFKIGVEAKGIHTLDKESKEKNKYDKCSIIFYIGDFEFFNIMKCKGYNLNIEKDTVKIVERIIKNIEKEIESDSELPNYFIKYKKITQLGRKILSILIKKYIKIIIYNASYFIN